MPGAGDVRINAGVHWGATMRLGAIMTAARFEVTALGEEVNEAARIEACATGGRVLVSKQLLERLDDDVLERLGIDGDVAYVPLADVEGAPDKARRDAPTLAVRPVKLRTAPSTRSTDPHTQISPPIVIAPALKTAKRAP